MQCDPIPKPGKRQPKSKRQLNPQKNSRIIDDEVVKAARRDYCVHCGISRSSVVKHVHHINQRSRGGSDIPENLICLCVKCHGEAHQGILKANDLKELTLMDIKQQ